MVTTIDHSIPGSSTGSDASKPPGGSLHNFHVEPGSAIDFVPLLQADLMATKTIYQSAYLRLVGLLRERRESLGISQARLATHLGWPQQRVSSVESGARRLDVLEFCLIAAALGFSPAEVSDQVTKMLQSVRGSRIRDRH